MIRIRSLLYGSLLGCCLAASVSSAPEKVQLTPVVMSIAHAPIPVRGGDRRYHLVYEVDLTNFTGGNVTINELEVRDARETETITTLDSAQIKSRLVVRDRAAEPGVMGPSQAGILYVHVISDRQDDIPSVLEHRLTTASSDGVISATAARVRVAPDTDLLLDPPLRGERYIAGDGCCDSTRHLRATLGVNGTAFTAQRFAIDWEQLDPSGRIYVGDRFDPKSYIIYGKPVYAVADGRVVTAVNDMQDTPIGPLPNLPLDKADGNHVTLALGDGRYALYAHFKPHSVQVKEGQLVKRGDLLGYVGTSGNSSEPHLHFHVTDGPTLASNGIPYLVRSFTVTKRGTSTEAFDKAIIDGTPMPTEPVPGPAQRTHALPLDLWIVDFP